MTATTIHINRPDTFPLRRITHCPTCKRRRRFAGLDAPWYGTTWTCCGCGDQWTDGKRHERPFRRGWRIGHISTAKKTWTAAAHLTRADHKAWLAQQLGFTQEVAP